MVTCSPPIGDVQAVLNEIQFKSVNLNHRWPQFRALCEQTRAVDPQQADALCDALQTAGVVLRHNNHIYLKPEVCSSRAVQ